MTEKVHDAEAMRLKMFIYNSAPHRAGFDLIVNDDEPKKGVEP